MTNRATLLAIALICIPSFVRAQAPEPNSAQSDSRIESPEGNSISLEMRWLGVNDNFIERVGAANAPRLPEIGSHAIYDQQTAELMIKWASGDKRASVDQVPTVIVASGKAHELSPHKATCELQGKDAILATISDDRKAIAVQLTWAKQTDGKERLPKTTAMVPVGSHLLVRTTDTVVEGRNEYFPPPLSYWEQLKQRLFGWKPKPIVSIGRERLQVFLLVTPRIASQEREQEQIR